MSQTLAFARGTRNLKGNRPLLTAISGWCQAAGNYPRLSVSIGGLSFLLRP
jgi:hypothetical protein